MSRLEPISETFRMLENRQPGNMGSRRICYLSPEKLKPSIRFALETGITHAQPERIIYDFHLIYLPDCTGEMRIGGTVYPLNPDSAFLVPPFVPNSVTYHSHGKRMALGVHFDLAPNFPSRSEKVDHRTPYQVQLRGGFDLPLFIAHSEALYPRLQSLLRSWNKKTALETLKAEAILTEILIDALIAQNTSADLGGAVTLRSEAAVKRAVDFIESHYAEPITPTKLAEVAGLSVSHLIRRFRAITGFVPMNYLVHIRMKMAARLLLNPDLTIKAVAAQVGYEDPYYFSKAFRKHDGLSPSQYRQTFLR